MARSITFLIGIARGRHHTQIRNSPQARFFNGGYATKKQTASPLGYAASLGQDEFVRLQERGAPGGGFFKSSLSCLSCLFSCSSYRIRSCSGVMGLPIPGVPWVSARSCVTQVLTAVSLRFMSLETWEMLNPCSVIILATRSLNSG